MGYPFTLCEVSGCDRQAKARGLCNRHYQAMRRAGGVTMRRVARSAIQQRFESKTIEAGDCLLWTGSLHKDGTGQFAVSGYRERRAHHWALWLAYGRFPDRGTVATPLCGHKHCVRPTHWRVTTRRDVAARRRRYVQPDPGTGSGSRSEYSKTAISESGTKVTDSESDTNSPSTSIRRVPS